MKLRFRNSKPKGVALAFALMTALLLMTLSTTVVGLSMRHARSGSESDYAQEALHAADWYLSAALDYMKGGGVNIQHPGGPSSYNNPYQDTTSLTSLEYGSVPPVIGRPDVSAEAIPLSKDQAAEYGMDDKNSPTMVRFHQSENNPLVYFPAGDIKDGYQVNDRFAVCDVVIEKNDPKTGRFGTKGTPGTYHLAIYSRVYDGSALTAVQRVQQTGSTRIQDYPTEGLLATRVIDVVARVEGPMDYLHIIQDGRSWRAQGINLDGGRGSLFNNLLASDSSEKVDKYLKNGLNVCGFPIDYRENGRMRIDGGTRMQSKNIGTRIRDSKNQRVYIDGTAQFFGDASDYTNRNGFASEFTQNESYKTMRFRGIQGQTAEGMKMDGDTLAAIYRGGVRDKEDPIGLPQSGENPNYDEDGKRIVKAYKERDTYQKFAKEKASEPGNAGMYNAVFEINGKVDKNSATSGVYVGKMPANGVPDVYSAGDGSDYRPSFAKIVVELGDSKGKTSSNNVFIYKENAGRKQLIKAINSTKINNGIISVSGGNVEVRSHNPGEAFDGDITIVSDVEATREDSLNLYNVDDNETFSKKSGSKLPSAIKSKDSIYSDVARKFFEAQEERLAEYKKDPSKIDRIATRIDANGKEVPLTPPYTIQELVDGIKQLDVNISGINDPAYSKNKAKNAKAYVWPTPTSEATEREGNVYITSDIVCKNNNGKRGTVGIVAKNYVALNDKDVKKKDGSIVVKKDAQGRVLVTQDPTKQTLNIEAMLFSFDKSVQFDWNNDAKNGTYKYDANGKLISSNDDTFQALRRGADKRQFNLTGCVVSSNLDIEGSEEGVGYLKQEERSNLSADNPAPFLPAYSEGVGRWVIVSYTDTGSRNWF